MLFKAVDILCISNCVYLKNCDKCTNDLRIIERNTSNHTFDYTHGVITGKRNGFWLSVTFVNEKVQEKMKSIFEWINPRVEWFYYSWYQNRILFCIVYVLRAVLNLSIQQRNLIGHNAQWRIIKRIIINNEIERCLSK